MHAEPCLSMSAPCGGFIAVPVLTAPNVGVLLLPVDEIPVDVVVFIFSTENKQNITLTAPDKHTNKMSDIHTEKVPHTKNY